MAERSSTRKMPVPDDGGGELDAVSMTAIRSVLTGGGQSPSKAKKIRLPRSLIKTAAAGEAPEAPSSGKAAMTPAVDPVASEPDANPHGPFDPLAPQEAAADDRPATPGLFASGKEKLMSYRPTRSHIFWGALALLLLFRPGLVIGVLVLLLLVLFVLFMVLGYDGLWHSVMRFGHWYADKRPAKGAALLARLDRFALRWDAFLDRFPEGTVDGLYLPDFAELQRAEAAHDAVLARRLQDLKKS